MELIDALRILHAADELRSTLPRSSRDRELLNRDIAALERDLHRLVLDGQASPGADEGAPAPYRTAQEQAVEQSRRHVKQLRDWLGLERDR